MPAHFDLAQQPCADNWMLVEEIEAPVLDTMIRHAGWHFMHLQGSCSRSGVGLTRDPSCAGSCAERAQDGVQRRRTRIG